MVHWKHRLDLRAIFELYKNAEISLKELAEKVAKRIEIAHFYSDYPELEDIVDEFYGLTDEDNKGYFEDIFSALYDWGDGEEPDAIKANGPVKSRTCWIERS